MVLILILMIFTLLSFNEGQLSSGNFEEGIRLKDLSLNESLNLKDVNFLMKRFSIIKKSIHW